MRDAVLLARGPRVAALAHLTHAAAPCADIYTQFIMGVMDVPTFATSILFKIPAFGALFYTFNCASFGLSLMDSMMPLMLGTSDELMPLVTDPVVDALFMGYAVRCCSPQTQVPRTPRALD